jgi:hypothetical protein
MQNSGKTGGSSEAKWWVAVTICAVAVGSVAETLALMLVRNSLGQIVLFIVTALVGAMLCRGIGRRLQDKNPDLLAAKAGNDVDVQWWIKLVVGTMAVGSVAAAVALTLVHNAVGQIVLFIVTALVGAMVCRGISKKVH